MTAPTFIEVRYRRETPGSAALMNRAAAVMPGGNSRTTSFHPPYPVVLERGDGPWLWDVDKRRYVDLFCNGLSLIHGNNYSPAREAIQSAMQRGTAWSGASREQIAFAELLCGRIEAMELLRFTNSGSEAGHARRQSGPAHHRPPHHLKVGRRLPRQLPRSGSGPVRPRRFGRPRVGRPVQRSRRLRARDGEAWQGHRRHRDRACARDRSRGAARTRVSQRGSGSGAPLWRTDHPR